VPDEQNVTLTKPGDWTIHPFGCRQVYIANVTVRNPPTIGHCDGFDPDLSRDVLFEHNDIEVGDDGIAVKSGACNVDNASDYCGAHELEKLLGHGTEDVIIQHSWIRHRFTKIGSNCGGTIRNITFRNLKSGTGPSHNGGLFIGTHRGMGATISDITYEDIVIRGRVNHWQSMPSSPIRMAMFYHAADLNATHGEYGVIANLRRVRGGCNLGTAHGCSFSHSRSSIPSARMVPQFAPRVERLIGLSSCALGPVHVDC
jgi:polygalacturonase